MERGGLASKKIGPKTALIILVLIAIPAFFWFRYLYDQFVVDKVSPEMAKMRDAMMRPKPLPIAAKGSPASKGAAPKKAAATSGEKGDEK